MKKLRWLLHHRIVRTVAGALAGVSLPVLVGLVLKALGLLHGGSLHGASLHSLLLDVGHHVKRLGALGGVGAGAGAGGAPTPQKNPNPDPCATEKADVQQDQTNIGLLNNQLKSMQAQMDALNPSINALAARAAALAPQVQYGVAAQGALTAIENLIQSVASASGGGGTAGISSSLAQLYQSFQACQGDLAALEALASGSSADSQFANIVSEMNQKIDEGYSLFNAINSPNGIQQQLQDLQNKLKADQQALTACQQSNSGNGSSGGDAGN
jgi:hypothetical protein